MINRFVAGIAAALVALAAGPATPAIGSRPSAAGNDLSPYKQSCVTVTLTGTRGVYRPDSEWWEPWFDATVRGRSTPCRRGDGAATLAVTQYHVRDGGTVGMMSTPWQAAAGGTTPFSRFGRIEPDVAALCVSTGLAERDGAVIARNAVCVRPERSGTAHLVTRFAPVRLTDPLVNAALSTYPTGAVTPTAPFCSVDCLVSPYRTYPPGTQRTTNDTPSDRPAEPLKPYESVCHTTSITDTFAGPSDENVNGFDVWLTGAVDFCDPNGPTSWIHAIRYWPDRGVVVREWNLDQLPLAKGAQVNENTDAICLASGIRERGGRLYGVHDLCWRIVKSQRDVYRLVPIRTDDPRVRKPLVSTIPKSDPNEPGGPPCASCL